MASGAELLVPIPPEPEQVEDPAAVAADEVDSESPIITPVAKRKR